MAKEISYDSMVQIVYDWSDNKGNSGTRWAGWIGVLHAKKGAKKEALLKCAQESCIEEEGKNFPQIKSFKNVKVRAYTFNEVK